MKYFASILVLLAAGTAPGSEMPNRGICAHRGASLDYPENTLAAFREAIWRGAQQIEFDVRTSADGHLVLMHDATVDRTTNGKGAVAKLALAQLKALDASGRRYGRFTNERIPTLGEVLSILPDNVWVNVHMQNGAAESRKAAMEIFAAGARAPSLHVGERRPSRWRAAGRGGSRQNDFVGQYGRAARRPRLRHRDHRRKIQQLAIQEFGRSTGTPRRGRHGLAPRGRRQSELFLERDPPQVGCAQAAIRAGLVRGGH